MCVYGPVLCFCTLLQLFFREAQPATTTPVFTQRTAKQQSCWMSAPSRSNTSAHWAFFRFFLSLSRCFAFTSSGRSFAFFLLRCLSFSKTSRRTMHHTAPPSSLHPSLTHTYIYTHTLPMAFTVWLALLDFSWCTTPSHPTPHRWAHPPAPLPRSFIRSRGSCFIRRFSLLSSLAEPAAADHKKTQAPVSCFGAVVSSSSSSPCQPTTTIMCLSLRAESTVTLQKQVPQKGRLTAQQETIAHTHTHTRTHTRHTLRDRE